MKVLVTGGRGFIGKNLAFTLENHGMSPVVFDIQDNEDTLLSYLKGADFIVHLAGVNRPLKESEFLDGNVNFTAHLLEDIIKIGSKAPILYASSTQAELDNPYGKSKKMAEDLLFRFQKEQGNPVYVYRFYNVYGKWCRPNYNSVIATFCHNIAHDIPLQVNPNAGEIDFVHIDDVCDSILKTIEAKGKGSADILYPEPHDRVALAKVVKLLESFKAGRKNLLCPLQEGFEKKLYATYLTYLEPEDFSYPLDPHEDNRGSFTEILKTLSYGQMSVNVAHPGITKGNHYHRLKTEKYIVVSGKCIIRQRKIDSDEVFETRCSGKDLRVVDIIPGYTHSIETVGEEDSVTLMWASELFDPENPDTYMMPVLKQ